MKLAVLGESGYGADGGNGFDDDGRGDSGISILKDREVKDPRWQIIALLAERSSVRETLRGLK